MTPTVTTQQDLLESLGYEELPEQLWVWLFDGYMIRVEEKDKSCWVPASVSAKGITLFMRKQKPRRGSKYRDEGTPEPLTLSAIYANIERAKAVSILDDNGKEILRRYV